MVTGVTSEPGMPVTQKEQRVTHDSPDKGLSCHSSLVTRGDFSGGDDRIRTCEGLLTLNGLANRRLQPLGHISVPESGESQF